MIVFLNPDEPTGSERIARDAYKAWIEDPKYLKVVDLGIGKYRLAILSNCEVELRTQRDRRERDGMPSRNCEEVVKKYNINDDDTIDGWVMISWMYDPEKNRQWNEELKQKIISTYRKETSCQNPK